jgi:Flp pilus assembly protein TadG
MGAIRVWRRRRGDAGVSAVELAVVAPALIGLIFLVIQAGLYLYARNVVDSAARYGVRTTREYNPNFTTQDFENNGQQAAETYAHQIAGKAVSDVAATANRDELNNRVTVTVTGKSISLIPGFDVSVKATHRGPIERFVPGGGP